MVQFSITAEFLLKAMGSFLSSMNGTEGVTGVRGVGVGVPEDSSELLADGAVMETFVVDVLEFDKLTTKCFLGAAIVRAATGG